MQKSEKNEAAAIVTYEEDILEDKSDNKSNSHLKLGVAILTRKCFFDSSEFTLHAYAEAIILITDYIKEKISEWNVD